MVLQDKAVFVVISISFKVIELNPLRGNFSSFFDNYAYRVELLSFPLFNGIFKYVDVFRLFMSLLEEVQNLPLNSIYIIISMYARVFSSINLSQIQHPSISEHKNYGCCCRDRLNLSTKSTDCFCRIGNIQYLASLSCFPKDSDS